MVWAAFTWNGLGPLVQLNLSLTENGYVQVFGDYLQLFMDFMYPNNDAIFMDDNVPGPQLFAIALKNILDNSSE